MKRVNPIFMLLILLSTAGRGVDVEESIQSMKTTPVEGEVLTQPFKEIELGGSTTISNSKISVTINRGKEGLSITNIEELDSGESYTLTQGAMLQLGELTKDVQRATVEHIDANNYSLRVEYPSIEVKQEFRLYEDIAVVALDYYVKRRGESIEEFDAKRAELLSFEFESRHWRSESVEFYDQTDWRNTLVTKQKFVGYGNLDNSRGNILKFTNQETERGLFFVKESPTVVAQLYYPGYDFSTNINRAVVSGAGLSCADISSEDWTRAYGVVIGFSGEGDVEWLKRLRHYQKQSRSYTPEDDDMIMMNTWGDRNKDGRISESFIIEELKEAARLGITHYQIDDGWQQALSKNSSSPDGSAWDLWAKEGWQPHSDRFPNGLKPVVKEAKKRGIKLGLWFHPSNHNNYSNWSIDADVVIDLYSRYGIRYFKIDGVQLPTKEAEINLRAFYDKVEKSTKGDVYFNLDVTADIRGGYHFMYKYGNIFVENRYTDSRSYYPCWTLRNLWMLSEYVLPEKLQMEFLNRWRREDKYVDDPFAPMASPFEYQFAITMVAQPLAWFEASGLPKGEIEKLAPVIDRYKQISADLHSGVVLPIGDEPTGASWTGFQSINDKESRGYLLFFRELNEIDTKQIKTYLPEGTVIELTPILGEGSSAPITEQIVKAGGRVEITLNSPHSYRLYSYKIVE